jgi:hypothetical protein
MRGKVFDEPMLGRVSMGTRFSESGEMYIHTRYRRVVKANNHSIHLSPSATRADAKWKGYQLE